METIQQLERRIEELAGLASDASQIEQNKLIAKIRRMKARNRNEHKD
jgi:hypothetical protein